MYFYKLASSSLLASRLNEMKGKAFLRKRKAFLRNFSAFLWKGKSVYMFDCDLIMVVIFVAVSSHVSLVKNNMDPLMVNNNNT